MHAAILGKYFWVNFDFCETCWKILLYYEHTFEIVYQEILMYN